MEQKKEVNVVARTFGKMREYVSESLIGKVYDIPQKGALGNAFSQGRDELAQALKAFPDAVHASNIQPSEHGKEQTGSVHGRSGQTRKPSPADIALGRVQPEPKQQEGKENGKQQDHGKDRGREM